MSVTKLVTLGFYNSSQGVGMKWRLFLEEGWGSSLCLSGHSLDCHPQCQKKLWEASSLCSHELLCTVTCLLLSAPSSVLGKGWQEAAGTWASSSRINYETMVKGQ